MLTICVEICAELCGRVVFLSLWHDTKASSSVEGGVFYAIGSHCVDRFNRNPGPRLGTCYQLALEDAAHILHIRRQI